MSEQVTEIILKQNERMEKKIDDLHEMIVEDRMARAKWHGRYLGMVILISAFSSEVIAFLKRKFLG